MAIGPLRQTVVKVTTTGSAGSASGNSDSEVINGYVEAIFLDFHASAPATTDTTISYKTRGGNILATTNTVTDAMFFPRATAVDNANAAITNAHTRFAVAAQKINVAVAQSDALTDCVTAYIYWSEE